jgi:hypothetical protein
MTGGTLFRLSVIVALFAFWAPIFLTTPGLSVLPLRQWVFVDGIAAFLVGAVSRIFVANLGLVGLSSGFGLTVGAIWTMVRYSQADTVPWFWWQYTTSEFFGDWVLYGVGGWIAVLVGWSLAAVFLRAEENSGHEWNGPEFSRSLTEEPVRPSCREGRLCGIV